MIFKLNNIVTKTDFSPKEASECKNNLNLPQKNSKQLKQTTFVNSASSVSNWTKVHENREKHVP